MLLSTHHRHRFLLWLGGSLILGLMLHGAEAAPASNSARQFDKGSGLKAQQTIRVNQDDLRVQLTQCLKEAEKVTCTFLVSSLNDDLTVWVSDPNREKSRVVDAEGNEYSAFEVIQFGKPESGALLIKKTPIRLIVSFMKLPEKLSGAALLELGLETYGHEIPVRFRKIEFLSASALEKAQDKPNQGAKNKATPSTPPNSEAQPEENPQGIQDPAADVKKNKPQTSETQDPDSQSEDIPAEEQQNTPGEKTPAPPSKGAVEKTSPSEAMPEEEAPEEETPEEAPPAPTKPQTTQPQKSPSPTNPTAPGR